MARAFRRLPGSSKLIWWRCQNGHEWQPTANTRSSNNVGCPFCYSIKPGFDSE
ncbi:MAG: zinc-ribbon domain-containing protein [Dehalococcoidia bacterium]